jgi:hypothetical protein
MIRERIAQVLGGDPGDHDPLLNMATASYPVSLRWRPSHPNPPTRRGFA